MSFENEHFETDGPKYRPIKEIEHYELVNGLSRLTFFEEDPFLMMQAYNISIVDQFIMEIEAKILQEFIEKEKFPYESTFLSAQSQMWIFAVYELIRTWKQRASEILKWHENGGLKFKLEQYEKQEGYNQQGRLLRAEQLKEILSDKSKVQNIKNDLNIIHVVFKRLETIRVYMAKHEVIGKPKLVAYMPGYGRINIECGALDYQLENESYIIGRINRRDIADEIRSLKDATPLSKDELETFDAYMDGTFHDGQ